ncbi:MAG TPA: hypothetical protein VNA20_16270 [Frankiaceae bacterium]|nr:hypothetical protein [Frankiaceae bacterium]
MASHARYTTLDSSNRRFLELPVAVARDDDAAPYDPDETRWCAHVCDAASPLAGLYAFAASFDAVRDAIAETAWAAITAGELVPFGLSADSLAGIYVVATTCEPYDGEALAAAAGNDAA